MLYKKINTYITHKFPFVGIPKRLIRAYYAKFSKIIDTYAQYNEDQIALEILSKRLDKSSIFYIDIGANHPSTISNTYLMYRYGSKGVTIDPNIELMKLHRLIRPRDIRLCVGCGRESGLSKFYYSKVPVLSSFSKLEVCDLWTEEYLPVFSLDKICEDLKITSIDFLSIDVEGLDIEVLHGAIKILPKTYLICIEACLLYTSPSPRDRTRSRMPSSA